MSSGQQGNEKDMHSNHKGRQMTFPNSPALTTMTAFDHFSGEVLHLNFRMYNFRLMLYLLHNKITRMRNVSKKCVFFPQFNMRWLTRRRARKTRALKRNTWRDRCPVTVHFGSRRCLYCFWCQCYFFLFCVCLFRWRERERLLLPLLPHRQQGDYCCYKTK